MQLSLEEFNDLPQGEYDFISLELKRDDENACIKKKKGVYVKALDIKVKSNVKLDIDINPSTIHIESYGDLAIECRYAIDRLTIHFLSEISKLAIKGIEFSTLDLRGNGYSLDNIEFKAQKIGILNAIVWNDLDIYKQMLEVSEFVSLCCSDPIKKALVLEYKNIVSLQIYVFDGAESTSLELHLPNLTRFNVLFNLLNVDANLHLKTFFPIKGFNLYKNCNRYMLWLEDECLRKICDRKNYNFEFKEPSELTCL